MTTIEQIDQLNLDIKAEKPFSKETLISLKNYFKIGTAYASNAIEGNSLTEGETKIVIEDGLTIAGKPLKDHLEAMGYSDSFDFLFEIKKTKKITLDDILKIHHLFYHRIDDENSGILRNKKVFISGTKYVPPSPEKLPALIENFIKTLNKRTERNDPVSTAIFAHRGLVIIHPFIDGNGRVARLLMNLILIQNDYFPTYIPPVLRSEYISAIRKASETNQNQDFDQFMAERILESMKEVKRLIM